MKSETLKTAKFLEMSEEDRKFELQVNRLRRQQHLVGRGRWQKLKRLLMMIAVSFGCLWGYSYLQGSKRGFIFSGIKAKEGFQSMVGELNQEQKIWDFVEN